MSRSADAVLGPTFTKEKVKLNFGYLGKTAGIIKLIELIFGSVCFGLALTGCAPTYIPWNGIGCLPMVVFFLLIIAIFFILTFILLILCLMSLDKVGAIHWHIMELIYNAIAVFFMVLSSCILISKTAKQLYYILDFRFNTSAGVFGILLAILYCVGTICSIREIKEEKSKVHRASHPVLWK